MTMVQSTGVSATAQASVAVPFGKKVASDCAQSYRSLAAKWIVEQGEPETQKQDKFWPMPPHVLPAFTAFRAVVMLVESEVTVAVPPEVVMLMLPGRLPAEDQ